VHARLSGLIVFVALAAAAPLGAQPIDNPDYTLRVQSGETAPGGTLSLPVLLDNFGDDIQGWSFGICLDESEIAVVGAALGDTTLTVRDGDPPDFEQINIEPGGWTMGVVICFFACAVLPPGTDYELAVADYQVLAPAGSNIPLCPCSTIGSPSINAVVVVDGLSVHPIKECGNAQVHPLVPFVRADTNADTFLDLSDGIWLLNYLFQDGPAFDCVEANDANDDGGLDTADPIYIVLYYFAGGAPPPGPFPVCGLIPNQTLEDCQVFPGCP
jgi:hypothetical protein